VRNIFWMFILFFIVAIASGCASGVYKVDWGQINKSSKVCVAKKAEVYGSGVSSPIFIDDKRIADIRIGQCFCTNIPSGLHSLQMEYTSIAFTFLPDETYYYFMENSFSLGLRARSVDRNFFITASEGYKDISNETP
jgi:hypothetical protein